MCRCVPANPREEPRWVAPRTARAPTGLNSRAEVRLGPSEGRSEAEGVSSIRRAPSDTASGGPRRASAREFKPVGALDGPIDAIQ